MRVFIGLLAAVALVAVLYLSGFMGGFMEGFTAAVEGHTGMPSCESSHGQTDATQAIGNSPFAKTNGVTVLAITEARKISANAQKVECAAMAILSNGQKGPINYSFTSDPTLGAGKYYIQAALDLPSFKPYVPGQ